MWTCPTCGETHENQFVECWKCFGKEHEYHVSEKPLPPAPPAQDRTLRPVGSILFRVAIAFVIGVIMGMAMLYRGGRPFAEAAAISLGVGISMGLSIAVVLWVVFPYEPARDAVENDENEDESWGKDESFS